MADVRQIDDLSDREYDTEVKRVFAEELAGKLTEDALTAILSDDPQPPVVFPVPEEHREAAAAWAAIYCLATSLVLCCQSV